MVDKIKILAIFYLKGDIIMETRLILIEYYEHYEHRWNIFLLKNNQKQLLAWNFIDDIPVYYSFNQMERASFINFPIAMEAYKKMMKFFGNKQHNKYKIIRNEPIVTDCVEPENVNFPI